MLTSMNYQCWVLTREIWYKYRQAISVAVPHQTSPYQVLYEEKQQSHASQDQVPQVSGYHQLSSTWIQLRPVPESLTEAECKQTKGSFPYEWIDGLDKLEQTSLPPHVAF